MKTRLFLLLLALIALSTVAAQPAAELLTPQLDADKDGDGVPDGWRRYVTFPGRSTLAVDPAVKLNGQGSLRVTVAQNSRCAITQWVKVPAGTSYTFGFRVKGQEAPVPVQAQIQWFRTVDWPKQVAPVREDPASPVVMSAGDWTQVAATGMKPEEADLALVDIIVGNAAATAGTVWLTDTSWRAGAFPAPLVTNPGFELDLNANGQPEGWGKAAYGPGFDLVRDDTVARSGKASARLTGAKDHGDRSCYTQATPLFTPPAKVKLSFWYKGTGLSTGIMHLLTPAGVQKPGGGIEYGVMTFTPELADEWRQFSQEIEVPAEARQAGIMRVDIILYQRSEGTLWYDDVELELIP